MKRQKKCLEILALCLALLCLAACGSAKPQAAKKLDMQAVYDSIAEKAELPAMMELSAKRLSNYYGIQAEDCVQAVAMVNEAGLSVDEIWLIEAVDEDTAKRIEDVARSRIEQLCAETEKYSAELYAVSKNGQVIRDGVNVALFISPDAETMASVFRAALG